MCGINGCVPPSPKISLMNKSLQHRGPDAFGAFSDDSVSLGHTRLSILDLSENGAQPMGLFHDGLVGAKRVEDAHYVIVFNGEIYNYKELQKELNISSINTTGDTGILLHAYKKWGKDCLNKLNGMFAFCIYDKKTKELFLARDRLGQKPLYYFYDGSSFSFSSELKGIMQIHKQLTLDKKAVELYFSMGFIPSPHSIFTKVFKLEAGHYLKFNIDSKKIIKKKYYVVPKLKPVLSKSESIQEYHTLMKSAVNYRLIADVPVGAFLSGGIDSSSVVAFTKKSNLHTFSVGFQGKEYDESVHIKTVKDFFKTIHHHKYYHKKDFLKDIDLYTKTYCEPFADFSGFPTLFVSELASKEVTVVLSGDGGDEIFGGYPWHNFGRQMDVLRKIPRFIRLFLSKFRKKDSLSLNMLFMFFEACYVSLDDKEKFFSKSFRKLLYKPESYVSWSEKNLKDCLKLSNNDLSEALRLFDLLHHTLADNFLTKVDRASMAHSIEVRSPYLDYRFIELSQKIPSKYKAGLFSGKKILKKSLEHMLPKSILYRKKQGFTPPLDKWILDKDSKTYAKQTLKKLNDFPDIVNFYKQVVFKNDIRPYRVYLIRLFLFGKWLDRWYSE